MAKFIWTKGDVSLTVRVGEMNRATALDCARDFEPLLLLPSDSGLLDNEIELLFVRYAPAAIIVGDKVVAQGDHTLDLPDGEKLTIILPMTRECYNALPITLARQWGECAAVENGWIYQDLKNALSRILRTINEPESGSALSNEAILPPLEMKTSGESVIPTASLHG